MYFMNKQFYFAYINKPLFRKQRPIFPIRCLCYTYMPTIVVVCVVVVAPMYPHMHTYREE